MLWSWARSTPPPIGLRDKVITSGTYRGGDEWRRHRPILLFRGLTKTSSSESSDDVVVDTRFKASGSRPPATNNKSRNRATRSAGNSSTRPLPSVERRGRSGRGVVAADTRTGDGGDALRPLVLAMGRGA